MNEKEQLTPDLTGEQVKEMVLKNGVRFIHVHNCSMCNYPCGFWIKGDEPFYDSGCNCVRYPSPLQPRDWDDVADNHNIQSRQEHRDNYVKKFTGIIRGRDQG